MWKPTTSNGETITPERAPTEILDTFTCPTGAVSVAEHVPSTDTEAEAVTLLSRKWIRSASSWSGVGRNPDMSPAFYIFQNLL
jgi:hypothetical protein